MVSLPFLVPSPPKSLQNSCVVAQPEASEPSDVLYLLLGRFMKMFVSVLFMMADTGKQSVLITWGWVKS